MDVAGAETWLLEAELLAVDENAIVAARETLDSRVIEVESARPIPVSALNLVEYAAPRYPNRAVDRGIEGWVDVEFTVDTDGVPQDILVVNASHDRYFRNEAVAAVSDWRFTPHAIRGRTVNQRAATRLSFRLQ